MKFQIILCLSTLLIVICAANDSLALNERFTLENRTVALLVNAVDEGGIKTILSEEGINESFFLTLNDSKKYFALAVEGFDEWDKAAIEFSERPFEFDPLLIDNTAWYLVPPDYLKTNKNELTIKGDRIKLNLSSITLFSLEDEFESQHFDKFIYGPGLFSQPPTDPAQDNMDVLHIDLEITLNTSAATIPSAVLTLTAKSLVNGFTTCVLDLDDNGGALTVSSVDSGPATSVLTYTHSAAQNRLFITLPAVVNQDEIFTVRVFYSGTPASSPFRRSTHSGVPVIYTESQAYNARKWWPCKDVPEDKFTADVHVTCPNTVYNGYPLSVVSNGSLISVVDNGNNTSTFNWSESYKISTQYVSITCTNYRVASGIYTALDNVTTMSVAHHVYPESYTSESQELPRTIEVMEHYADLFGEYPFLSEKYVTSTWGISYGMEHQTCTSMPNGNLNNPPYHRRNVHELAHMWFGDAVGIDHFNHLWISEGWATYCEALWLEHKEGISSYHAKLNSWTPSDAYPIVSSSADNFSWSIVYTKGAWVLHMLRHVIGDTAFFTGAQTYLSDADLRFDTALSSDLQAHMEAAHGSDLSWFFDTWLYQANRPNYTWGWFAHNVGGNAIVELGIEQTQSGGLYSMPIDFRVHLQGGGTVDFTVTCDKAAQNFSVDIGPGTVVDIEFDPDNWLLEYKTESGPPSVVSQWHLH